MSTLSKTNPGRVEIVAQAEAEAWKKAQNRAFDKLAANVTIKGFRKGAAPRNLVAPHIDPNNLFNEAVREAFPEIYSKAVEEHKLRPFSQPDIEITKVSNEELELKISVTLMPEVELGQYKGLHAEKGEAKVNKEEVEESIKKQLEGAAELVVTEEPAKMGDTVVFDFVGYIDDKPFEGGSAENFSLELGSGQFVPGFEEGLVGVKSNEEKDVDITFPENYVKELASKKALFKCKIHEVKVKKIPELNDEAVLDLGIENVKTVDELRKKTEEDLLKHKQDEAKGKYYQAILEQIVNGSKIDLAEEIVHQEAHHNLDELKSRIESQGLSYEQYLQITNQTEEAVHQQFHEQSEKGLKEFCVLQEVGAKENLAPTEEEIKAEYKRIADTYKMSVEDVEKALSGNNQRLVQDLYSKKIQDFLLANND